jgi:hypothetical protein
VDLHRVEDHQAKQAFQDTGRRVYSEQVDSLGVLRLKGRAEPENKIPAVVRERAGILRRAGERGEFAQAIGLREAPPPRLLCAS